MAYDVGTLRLIDYKIQVGTTGISFVAGLSGYLAPNNTAVFDPLQIEWAYHRAASTLAFMGLINGQTVAFLRQSVPLTVDDAATLMGVSSAQIMAWESGAEPVSVQSWQVLADYCCQLDDRAFIGVTPLPAMDFRPRTIRIFPDVPMPVQVYIPTGNSCGCPK